MVIRRSDTDRTMQFLAYDSDGDNGSDCGADNQTSRMTTADNAETNVLVQSYASKWTEASSSSSDEDDAEEDKPCTNPMQQESGLIDANILLSSVTEKPKFLARNVVDKYEVSEINRTQHYSSVDSEQKAATRAAKPTTSKDIPKNITRAIPVALQQAANLSSNSRSAPVSTDASTKDLALKKKLDERDALKETAKVMCSCLCGMWYS